MPAADTPGSVEMFVRWTHLLLRVGMGFVLLGIVVMPLDFVAGAVITGIGVVVTVATGHARGSLKRDLRSERQA
jgi:hypothetical protein